MKKILLVIDNLGSGGAQRQIVNLALALKREGYGVQVFIYQSILHFEPDLAGSEIPLYCFPKKGKYSFRPVLDLRRLVRELEIDVVVSFLETPSLYAEIAMIGLSRPKLVVSERFMYPEGRIPIRLRVMQEFHRLADKITVNSHHQRVRMVKEFPWMGSRISTIYNGYELDRYRSIGHGANDRIEYLSIASVSRKKNSINLAKALRVLRDMHGISVHVSWVGVESVAIEGRDAFEETDKYLEENGLRENWSWLGERRDVPALLAQCKALIHPSYFEGLPNVICEALASGKPVLASCVCDHPILVRDDFRGYLFDPNSPESIAESILRFERLDTSGMSRMGHNSRMYAESELSLEVFKESYCRLIEAM